MAQPNFTESEAFRTAQPGSAGFGPRANASPGASGTSSGPNSQAGGGIGGNPPPPNGGSTASSNAQPGGGGNGGNTPPPNGGSTAAGAGGPGNGGGNGRRTGGRRPHGYQGVVDAIHAEGERERLRDLHQAQISADAAYADKQRASVQAVTARIDQKRNLQNQHGAQILDTMEKHGDAIVLIVGGLAGIAFAAAYGLDRMIDKRPGSQFDIIRQAWYVRTHPNPYQTPQRVRVTDPTQPSLARRAMNRVTGRRPAPR